MKPEQERYAAEADDARSEGREASQCVMREQLVSRSFDGFIKD